MKKNNHHYHHQQSHSKTCKSRQQTSNQKQPSERTKKKKKKKTKNKKSEKNQQKKKQQQKAKGCMRKLSRRRPSQRQGQKRDRQQESQARSRQKTQRRSKSKSKRKTFPLPPRPSSLLHGSCSTHPLRQLLPLRRGPLVITRLSRPNQSLLLQWRMPMADSKPSKVRARRAARPAANSRTLALFEIGARWPSACWAASPQQWDRPGGGPFQCKLTWAGRMRIVLTKRPGCGK
mmetsp:Transcript_38978/g.82888  ORF Transcript_38978/g.82888 Transcript_38978/m.82888 type:complete len:232 (-) Transcript_38978:22-717(-)